MNGVADPYPNDEISERVLSNDNRSSFFNAVINNISDIVIMVDNTGKIIFENICNNNLNKNSPKVYKCIFFGKKAVINDKDGNPFVNGSHPLSRLLKGEYINQEIISVKKNNSVFYYKINAVPIFDKKEELNLGILFLWDVTDKVIAEKRKTEELEAALRMKEDFLLLISHEFKTPITVILSALQAIDHFCSNEISEKCKDYLGKIRKNVNRQLKLVNNLLDITSARTSKIHLSKKKVDIISETEAIIENASEYAKFKNIDICFITNVNKSVVWLDEEKYERVMLNLLSNAIKYTDKGKKVTVSIHQGKGFFKINVCDNGVGISRENQKKIFERFGQVDNTLVRLAEGVGIGLPLVKHIVEAMGGTITVKSRIGVGSVFTVTLPREDAPENYGDEFNPGPRDPEEERLERLINSTALEFSDVYL